MGRSRKKKKPKLFFIREAKDSEFRRIMSDLRKAFARDYELVFCTGTRTDLIKAKRDATIVVL